MCLGYQYLFRFVVPKFFGDLSTIFEIDMSIVMICEVFTSITSKVEETIPTW